MVRRCQDASWLARDTETSGLRWDLGARAVGYVYSCFREGGAVQSYYLPFRHLTGEAQISEEVAQQAEAAVQRGARADQRRWWWNLPFDKHILRKEGFELDQRDQDAQIAARLYDENIGAKLKERALADLGDLTAKVYEDILGRETVRLAALNGMKKGDYVDRYGYSQIPIHMAGEYATRDGEYTLRLAKHYWDLGVPAYYGRSPRGPEFPGIWDTEQRLAHVLCDVEEWGLPIDRPYIEWLRGATLQAAGQLEAQIWDTLGHHRRFNVDSDDELRHFLTKVLGLQLWRKTRGGEFSVDRETLEEFEDECPVLGLIKDRREATKIASTYTNSLLSRCDQNDYLHGSFLQMGTNSGRAAMTRPSLQNIASDSDKRAEAATGKKLEDGGRDPWSVRRAFVCRPGYVRLYLDWSQVELRELADASQDPQLLDVYRTGGDVHDRTSMLIYKTAEKAKRRTAKVANFGTAYGLTVPGLSRRAKIPLSEAESFMADFWREYGGVDQFRRALWAEARRNGGWISNKFGRTRRVPRIFSSDERTRESAERQLMASRIQGGAGDLSKDAFVRVEARLRTEGLDARICGWVHDEIAIDVRPQDFARAVMVAKAEMEHFPDYAVPILADAEYTRSNWSEKTKVPGL